MGLVYLWADSNVCTPTVSDKSFQHKLVCLKIFVEYVGTINALERFTKKLFRPKFQLYFIFVIL